MSRSPDLAHKHRDLIDTIRAGRRPKPRPVTNWVPVARCTAERNYISTGRDDREGDTGSENDGFIPVFKNSWTSVRAPYQSTPTKCGGTELDGTVPPVEFYLSHNGEVRLHGHITGGQIGTVVFVLPEGYRPRAVEKFICPSDTGGYAVISINPNGEVIVDRISTT